ncbi:hypothetical protein, partial [Plasmodium yoelii yoelii]
MDNERMSEYKYYLKFENDNFYIKNSFYFFLYF